MAQGRTHRQRERDRLVRELWTPPGPEPAGPGKDPDLLPGPGETLDRLGGDWCIFQLDRGHRYSTDDLVVAAWGCSWYGLGRGTWEPGFQERLPRSPRRILDLGCGIGSVGLLAAWRFPEARLVGIEAQEVSVGLARRSVRYDGLQDRATIIHGDLRDHDMIPDLGSYDLVFGSPPYLPHGTGVQSQVTQRGPCRFEDRGGVEAYCVAAAKALAPSGTFALVFTHRDRDRVMDAASAAGLEVWATRPVVTRQGKPPLLELYAMSTTPPGPVRHLPPLVVRDDAGRRTGEMDALRVFLGFPPAEVLARAGRLHHTHREGE